MKTIKNLFIFFILYIGTSAQGEEQSFSSWLIDFKKLALKNRYVNPFVKTILFIL